MKLPSKAIREIRRRLEDHPSDSWGCADCFRGRPCIEKVILQAALANLESREKGQPAGRALLEGE